MIQSTSSKSIHAAIIMDGNGRWATARGLARVDGHRAGALAVSRVVESAAELAVGTLTLYAFSSDNWRRPAAEVAALMRLFESYLRDQEPRCVENGIRLEVIGRRDRLSRGLVAAIEDIEASTERGARMRLRIAVDYSARDSILAAARRVASHGGITREGFTRLLAEAMHATAPVSDVDLLIRTGGELRLSDFLLWESAYAELVFTPKMWPDFERADLVAALHEFHQRDRRFGALKVSVGQ
ncbi:MAG: di-trans,poly-cis-decaprenylcistransferase [Candidatus Solibacter usitatus]|nr:di-trans,poly-cis-decaprenylcistransferase [Candidatus Solibacter usitatus]